MKTNLWKFLAIFLACFFQKSFAAYDAFADYDEGPYLGAFNTLIKDSYSAPIPSAMASQCKNQQATSSGSPNTLTISSSMTSSELQTFCGTNSICKIPAGLTVTMNSNLNVAALVVSGTLNWDDESQTANDQWLCAGYVGVNGGRFNMNVTTKNSYIYIKNNGLKDTTLYTRVLGAYNGGKVKIIGRKLRRTWSLLAEQASFGMSNIHLLHNPQEMGWRVGDRIVIATTEPLSEGNAEDYAIGSFTDNNGIKLVNRDGTVGLVQQIFLSKAKVTGPNMTVLMQAEVINLSRNILITGDDFVHLPCKSDSIGGARPDDSFQADHCSCWGHISRSTCTAGLHTMAIGKGSVLSLEYTRIEKCGQRGILGKYCIHLHLIQECTECKIIGNAVEFGQQRGTVIHGTHLATVEHNVYNDIRGATIYIEDGNEMYNRINYNVGICPWAKPGEKRGCTVPGTDNDQADTTLNQSGLWGVSFTNYAIGNRFANNYNGMLYQEQGFPYGRGHVDGLECPSLQQIGRLEGNTFHSCGRFGTYVLASVFPKRLDRTIARNGLPDKSTCKEWTATGEDTGLPASFMNNVDYGNVFVGQYNSGDLQYRFHTSIDNYNLIYWKETKNFQDGCSAHLADSFYENGNLALPGGHGTFILENMIFKGKIHFESSHHCNEGVTGVLCMPTYVFTNMDWTGEISDSNRILQWGPNNGAMFTLGPEENVKGNNLFPPGYRSIVHPYWTYLLELDNGQSCFKDSHVATELNKDPMKFKQLYDGGAIFCKRPVRRLEVFTFSLTPQPPMSLELWQNGKMLSNVNLNHFQIGERKQGYSATVVPGLDHQYKLSLGGGPVSPDWIIEFSDPIFGNRWERDEIDLVVAGRNCPKPVHSQHDRRFIWSGDNYLTVKGRGACTTHPDMPAINCKTQPKLSNIESCPGKCATECNNGYCDCATGECLCTPGFSGTNCTIDTCGAAGCVHGYCASRYLGGDLLVSNKQCVCEEGWYGEKCDSNVAPPPPPPVTPVCLKDCYFFPDTSIDGPPIGVIQTRDPKACCAACQANGLCNSWHIDVICFLKAGTDKVPKNGIVAGIKCSAGTGTIAIPPDVNACKDKCKGAFPYGCSTEFKFGYCSAAGGCNYDQTNDPTWCCYKGCNQSPVTPSPITQSSVSQSAITQPTQPVTQPTQPTASPGSCKGRCPGDYPFGCNPGFNFGYCNSGGGCSYSEMNDPNWCCFKGCGDNPINPVTNPVVNPSTTPTSTGSCKGKCQGEFPFGCNTGFSLGYCNGSGGCSYTAMNDPSWCCFKGC